MFFEAGMLFTFGLLCIACLLHAILVFTICGGRQRRDRTIGVFATLACKDWVLRCRLVKALPTVVLPILFLMDY